MRVLLLLAFLLTQHVTNTGNHRKVFTGGGGAHPTFVTNQICEADANFGGIPLTFTFGTCVNPISSTTTSNVGVGSALVIAVFTSTGASTPTSITCGATTATLAVTIDTEWMYYCPNSGGGAVTVTAAFSSYSAQYRIIAQEYSGAAASPLDGVGSFVCSPTCGSTTITAAGLSTSHANVLIVEFCVSSGPGITVGASPISFTGRYVPSFAQITGDGLAIGTGAQSPTCDNYGVGSNGDILAMGLRP